MFTHQELFFLFGLVKGHHSTISRKISKEEEGIFRSSLIESQALAEQVILKLQKLHDRELKKKDT